MARYAHDIDAYTRNLLAIYAQTSTRQRAEGRHWYADVHSLIHIQAQMVGWSQERVAAVYAALSANNAWDKNVVQGDAFIRAAIAGGKRPTATSPYAWRAWNIATGAEPYTALGGIKVTNFWANLLEREGAERCTVDVWAARAALNNWALPAGIPNGLFRACAQAYVRAANVVSLLPYQFQAVVWVAAREGVRP